MPTNRPAPAKIKLSDALGLYTDIEELGDEMENWRDSIPESLQGGDKFDEVNDAAEALHGASSDLETACDELKLILGKVKTDGADILDQTVAYTERKMYKGYSPPRWVRLSNTVSAIRAALDYIESSEGIIEAELDVHDFTSLYCYVTDASNSLDDLDSIEFPSMY